VVLLSRVLVTLDGTLRTLAPDYALLSAAMDLVGRKDEQALLDRKELVREEMLAMLPHLRRLPERVDRLLTLTGRGELRVRSVLDEDAGRIVRTLVNRLLLVLAGTSFLASSVWLLTATNDGPQITGDAGLFDAFGYGGLSIGAVLILRVVAAVARDGTI
jgi:ubiquinone biosynthesis protein